MGGCSSRPSDDTTVDDGPAQRRTITNGASLEAKISMATSDRSLQMALPGPDTNAFGNDRRTPFPTENDMTQLAGRALGWAESMPLQPLATPRLTRRSTPGPHNYVGGYNPPEALGQANFPPLPPAQSRRGSISSRHNKPLESLHHSSGVKQIAPGSSLQPSNDPDIEPSHPSNHSTLHIWPRLETDELRDGFPSASGRRSERRDPLDCTGQLKGKPGPKLTGLFSDVSPAKLGDRVVAVKTLRVPNIEGGESPIWKRLAKDIDVWATLNHPNVLELLGFALEEGKPCLISPWCENGTLQQYLQKFPDANRRRLVREIAEGLKYLHMQTPPIIHGDLKTTNVLVTGSYVAKISNFGGSGRVEQLRTGFTTDNLVLATIRYSAPEILRDGQHPTLPSDVFSLACVALETMTDKCPFWKTPKIVEIIPHVVLKKQTPSREDHPGMEDAIWELLRKCWNYEPSDRPRMVDVCRMLAEAGCGPSTDSCPPTPAGPPSLPTRFDRPRRGTTTV